MSDYQFVMSAVKSKSARPQATKSAAAGQGQKPSSIYTRVSNIASFGTTALRSPLCLLGALAE